MTEVEEAAIPPRRTAGVGIRLATDALESVRQAHLEEVLRAQTATLATIRDQGSPRWDIYSLHLDGA